MGLFAAPNPKQPEMTPREALEFAQKVAREELDRLDRMHSRWMRYFGLVGVVLTLIGWATIRAVVMNQVSVEVKSQIATKLNQEVIDREISNYIQAKGATAIDGRIQHQIDEGMNNIIAQRIGPLVAVQVQQQRELIVHQVVAQLRQNGLTLQPSIVKQLSENAASAAPVVPGFKPPTQAVGRFDNARILMGISPVAEVTCTGSNQYFEDMLVATLVAAKWNVTKRVTCSPLASSAPNTTVRLRWPKSIPRRTTETVLHIADGEVEMGLWELFEMVTPHAKREIVPGNEEKIFYFDIF